MSEITEALRGILTDGIRLLNNAATSVADSTRYKLNELDNMSRRREAMGELGQKVYDMFLAGVEMPEESLALLTELRALDDGLQTLRTEHAEQKQVRKQKLQEENAARKEQRAAAKAARAEAKAAMDAERAAQAEAARAAAAAAAAEAAASDLTDFAAAAPVAEVPTIAEEIPVAAETVVEPVVETVVAEAAQDDEPMLM